MTHLYDISQIPFRSAVVPHLLKFAIEDLTQKVKPNCLPAERQADGPSRYRRRTLPPAAEWSLPRSAPRPPKRASPPATSSNGWPTPPTRLDKMLRTLLSFLLLEGCFFGPGWGQFLSLMTKTTFSKGPGTNLPELVGGWGNRNNIQTESQQLSNGGSQIL